MPNFNIQKVILYPRKSREDEQREKETGEDCLQIMTDLLIETCRRFNIPEWDVKPEIGSADTIDGRPVFKGILEQDFPSGEYQGIAVRDISRLGRGNFTDAGRIYDGVIQCKTYIVTPGRIYDPASKADLRFIRMELFMARENYETIKDTLWYGRDERAKKGYAPGGRCSLGFTTVRGNYHIIPDEADTVRDIFELRAQEISYREIANILNQNFKKSKQGKVFHDSTIKKVIHNKKYIGISPWMGKDYESKCPSLIPLDLWNHVHDVVNPRRTKKGVYVNDNDYLVTLYCHECGNRMYGDLQRSRRVLASGVSKLYNSYITYSCAGRKRKHICDMPQIKGELVHRMVLDELGKLVTDKSILEGLNKRRINRLSIDKKELSSRLDRKTRLVKQKESFLIKLEQDYSSGELAPKLYSIHREKTELEIEALKSETLILNQKLKTSGVNLMTVDNIVSKLNRFLSKWDTLDNRKRKALIRGFLPKIEVDRNHEFYFELNLPDNI